VAMVCCVNVALLCSSSDDMFHKLGPSFSWIIFAHFGQHQVYEEMIPQFPHYFNFERRKFFFFFFYMYFFLSNFYLCKQEYSEKVLQMTKHSLIFFSHVIQMGKGFNCRKSKLHLIMPIIYFFTNSYKLTMILLDDVPCLCLFQPKKKKKGDLSRQMRTTF
jgi:hypothetical protein